MFTSKFNCFQIQTTCDHTKETKLQKHLRERNQQLLEKCFNIRIEQPQKEQQNSNNDKSPQQPTIRETYEQKAYNSTKKDLKQSDVKEINNPVSKSQTMNPIKSASSSGNKTKQRPQSAPNRSFNSTGLKPLNNTPQSARLPPATNWKSPFNSFITKGTHFRLTSHSQQASSEFAYDLSRDELKFVGKFSRPMKPLPEAERQLLKNGQRKEYLTQRYEHSPVIKYNYPEATSWRIGWLQQIQ
ncbi:uncharacterized protein LOC111688266 [Lucilia cuprina]|uniref:uncharacterized protein LOC111688266 n=1 Tax=Lucilia cuprina TaxID=7375 RepID=UPI001F06F149|nr:uncharacterized protein LOC111688266 [Lucilia cuprina]